METENLRYDPTTGRVHLLDTDEVIGYLASDIADCPPGLADDWLELWRRHLQCV